MWRGSKEAWKGGKQVGCQLQMQLAACGRVKQATSRMRSKGEAAAKVPGQLTSITTLFGVVAAAAAASPSAVVVRHCGLAICPI